MKFAEVAVELNIDRPYTYAVPGSIEPIVAPGLRVRVPFGGRELRGFVTGVSEEPVQGAKEIKSAVEKFPAISIPLLGLGRWISQYYVCGLGEALRSMLPGAGRLADVCS